MNRILTVILTAVVSIGLITYALSLTSTTTVTVDKGVVRGQQLEPRPEEVPKTEVPEPKAEEQCGNIEAGDGVESLEAPALSPFKLSTGSRKVLEKKLAEAKSMVKSRKKWIEETKVEIADLRELANSVPEDSTLYKGFKADLERKENYLTTQYTRLAEGEKEIMLIEAALGGE